MIARDQASIVVIGAGQAGGRAVAELRAGGFSGPLTLVGDEGRHPYERPPLSKAVLIGSAGADDALVNPSAFYHRNAVECILDDAAVRIDRDRREVVLRSGRSLSYDLLILATGSLPRQLDLPGGDLTGVLSLRTAADAEHLRDALRSARRLVAIGGGVVSLEVGAVARAMGIEVTVIERSPRCLARVLPQLAADHVVAAHERAGTTILCDTNVSALLGAEQVEAVRLDDGRVIDTDLVLIGVGSTPADALARDAGLVVSDGIVVDSQYRSSDPLIYAIGDVAHPPGGRRESWQNAEQGAVRVAAAILGRAPSSEEPPWFWSDQGADQIQLIGSFASDDNVYVDGDAVPAGMVHLHLRDDVLVGAVMINAGRMRRRLSRLIGFPYQPLSDRSTS